MRKKKKTGEMQLEEKYLTELKKLRVPLLTLDARWHQLFPEHKKTKRLARLEKELNDLVKRQGQLNQNLKDYANAKKALMENILLNMTDGSEPNSAEKIKKQDRNQKYLDELKEKTEQAEEHLETLPDDITRKNQELLIESMRICYETLITNTKEIENDDIWISTVRAMLTQRILHKQDLELRNEETYKFMYDLLGKRIIDMFDKDYDVWKRKE